MNTECKDCILLESLDSVEINKFCHVCTIDKIPSYEQRGIVVSEDREGFPVLENFLCPFKRTNRWWEENLTQNIDDIEQYILEENGFPYSVFIYEQKEIDMRGCVQDILKFDILPKYVHITFKYMNQDDELLRELSSLLEGAGIKYKLVINLDEDLDDFYESFLAFRLNLTTPFIGVIYNRTSLKDGTLQQTSTKIQKDLLSFPYANTADNSFLLFPVSIIEEYLAEDGHRFIDRIMETQCQNYLLPQ